MVKSALLSVAMEHLNPLTRLWLSATLVRDGTCLEYSRLCCLVHDVECLWAFSGPCSVLPAVHTVLPAVHTVLPAVHTVLVAVLPAVHTILPAVQTALPAVHTALPAVHTVLPAVHTVLPPDGSTSCSLFTKFVTTWRCAAAVSDVQVAGCTRVAAVQANVSTSAATAAAHLHV
jgi:hypothetical protein